MFRLALSLVISLMLLAPAAPATGSADATPPANSTTQTAPVDVPAGSPAPDPGRDSARPTTQATQPAGITATPGAAPGGGTTAAPTSRPGSPLESFISSISPFYLIILVVGVMMFFQVRSRRNQEKAQKERLNSIKRGDRVQTVGGILGNVVQTEERRVLVKVDETNNTKIWFARDAIRGVLEEEKSEGKDAKGGK